MLLIVLISAKIEVEFTILPGAANEDHVDVVLKNIEEWVFTSLRKRMFFLSPVAQRRIMVDYEKYKRLEKDNGNDTQTNG